MPRISHYTDRLDDCDERAQYVQARQPIQHVILAEMVSALLTSISVTWKQGLLSPGLASTYAPVQRAECMTAQLFMK